MSNRKTSVKEVCLTFSDVTFVKRVISIPGYSLSRIKSPLVKLIVFARRGKNLFVPFVSLQSRPAILRKSHFIPVFNHFTAPASKISGLKIARTRLRTV